MHKNGNCWTAQADLKRHFTQMSEYPFSCVASQFHDDLHSLIPIKIFKEEYTMGNNFSLY